MACTQFKRNIISTLLASFIIQKQNTTNKQKSPRNEKFTSFLCQDWNLENPAHVPDQCSHLKMSHRRWV